MAGWSCTACGAGFSEPRPKCSSCNAFGSIRQGAATAAKPRLAAPVPGRGQQQEEKNKALPIDQIDKEEAARIPTGIGEFDRVLGGGAVLGGLTLVGGDPGVGKSTLLLQALALLSQEGHRALYVTGEESAAQIAARAGRLDAEAENLFVIAETQIEPILDAIEETGPEILVIDSVQTIQAIDGPAGSVSQVREVTSIFRDITKQHHISTFLIGHVTKDGGLAGPKTLEHLVDTVLAFEGERGQAFRTLRTQKNRYGSATEVGIFEMTAQGMREVPNASEFFLAERSEDVPGTIIAATSEGNRSMLVEIQALVGAVKQTGGRISCTGIDSARLGLILAVLEKRLDGKKAAFGLRDIFVNIAGGVKVNETAVDLPVALALMSSLLQIPIPSSVIAFGEVGLTGEIRGVARTKARLSEASTMGFEMALIPRGGTEERPKKETMEIVAVATLEEALEVVLVPSRSRQESGRKPGSAGAKKKSPKTSRKLKS